MALSDFGGAQTTSRKTNTSTNGLARFGSKTTQTKPDLRTTTGLRTLAEQEGLQKQLTRIPERGEKPKEFWSGGFISDTFDTLNALQYGVTGVIKGKSFKEGIDDRESFTDEDALGGKGVLPFITGIALDIATDPLTYVGGLGLVGKAGKALGLTKKLKQSKDILAKTAAGKQLGRHFVYRFGQDPVYREMSERAVRNSQREVQNIVNLTKPIKELDGATQREITRARELGQLGRKKKGPKITRPLADVAPTTQALKAARTVTDELTEALTRDEIISKAQSFLRKDTTKLQNIELQEVVEDMTNFLKKVEKGRDSGHDLYKAAEALNKVSKGRLKIRPVINLTKAQKANADAVFTKLDDLSADFAKLMFKPGSKVYNTFMNNVGTYMRRTYRTIETGSGKVSKFATKSQKAADASLTKMRKDLPDDVLEALDEIREAGYPTAKVMVQLSRSVENLRLLKQIDEVGFASDTAQKGLRKLPKSPNYGAVAGKYVPEPIYDDLTELLRPAKTGLDKVQSKIVGTFKFGKVILNPATHIRNNVSNLILNNFEGLSPARIDIYAQAARQISKKGKWYKEAQKQGLGLDSFAANEISTWLDPKMGGIISGTTSKTKNALTKIADMYQKEEEFAKMAQYIFQRKKGLDPEQAWKVAERATFNYAQVTPTIRRIRESIFGYPFITFTYKATPQVLRTMLNKPTKISNIGKIKQGIENQIYAGATETTRQEMERMRATEPDWIKNGFYLTLPFKDSEGRPGYFDMTYMLPFGDLVSGAAFEAPINPDTGFQEGIPERIANQLAFVSLGKEIVTNQDFYGNKIWKESDSSTQKIADIFRHLTKTMTPPIISDVIPGGYTYTGERREGPIPAAINKQRGVSEGGKQQRTGIQEIARNLGIKINPADIDIQENFAERQEQRAIKTILEEAGVTGQFDITYLKDKEDETE